MIKIRAFQDQQENDVRRHRNELILFFVEDKVHSPQTAVVAPSPKRNSLQVAGVVDRAQTRGWRGSVDDVGEVSFVDEEVLDDVELVGEGLALVRVVLVKVVGRREAASGVEKTVLLIEGIRIFLEREKWDEIRFWLLCLFAEQLKGLEEVFVALKGLFEELVLEFGSVAAHFFWFFSGA